MQRDPLASAALAFALLIAAPAQAETVRVPQAGTPAFVVTVPDGWKQHATSDRSIELYREDMTASVRFSVASNNGKSMDEMAARLAQELGATPPRNKSPTMLAGRFGTAYDSDVVNSSGTRISLRIIGVPTGGGLVAGVMTLVPLPADPAREADLKQILDQLTLMIDAPPLSSWGARQQP